MTGRRTELHRLKNHATGDLSCQARLIDSPAVPSLRSATMPTPISVPLCRLALLAPLALGLAGCKMFNRNGGGDATTAPSADATTQPSTQPADNRPRSRWPHGGAMANV